MKKFIITLAILMAGFSYAAVWDFTWFGKSVASAGTPVQLTNVAINTASMTIQSTATNTGTIYIQRTSAATTNRFSLTPGQALTISAVGANNWVDMSTIYIDATVNGEGVSVSHQSTR